MLTGETERAGRTKLNKIRPCADGEIADRGMGKGRAEENKLKEPRRREEMRFREWTDKR